MAEMTQEARNLKHFIPPARRTLEFHINISMNDIIYMHMCKVRLQDLELFNVRLVISKDNCIEYVGSTTYHAVAKVAN